MSDKKINIGSAILDEFWHATAEAPSRFDGYNVGLDVLGATRRAAASRPISTSARFAQAHAAALSPLKTASHLAATVKNTAAKPALDQQKKSVKAAVSTAAKKAIASAKKIARIPKLSRASAKLTINANKLLKKTTTVVGQMYAAAPDIQQMRANLPAVLQMLKDDADEINAVSAVADAANQLYSTLTQMQSSGQDFSSLVDSGSKLLDQCNSVISAYDPDSVDPSLTSQAQALLQSIQQWQAQAQSGAGAAPFDPGSAGGGGGGGGGGAPTGDDSSPSSSDDSGFPPSAGDGYAADGAGDFGDSGGDISADDAVAQFRASGGQWDPFEDSGAGPSDADLAQAEQDAASLDAGDAVDDSASAGEDDGMVLDDGSSALDQQRALLEADDVAGAFLNDVSSVFTGRSSSTSDAEAAAVFNQYASGPKSSIVSSKLTATSASKLTPSPTVAAKLAASQARLQQLQQQLAAIASTSDNSSAGTIMGFPTEELADIIVESYQQQITDAEEDPVRRHGSVHRGAAYLQEHNYPPYGVSSGQEGGSMRPGEKVEVFGSDYSHGLDILGAGPMAKLPVKQSLAQKVADAKAKVKANPRAGFVAKSSPGGAKRAVLVLNQKKHDHMRSIKNARDAGKRAISLGNKLNKILKNPQTKVKGAIPLRRGGQHFSDVQLKQFADKAIKAGKEVLAHADKHEKLYKSHVTKVKTGVLNARKTYGPSGRKGTQVRGVPELERLEDVLGAVCDILGDVPPAGYTGPTDDGSGSTDPTMLPSGTVDTSACGNQGQAPTADSVQPQAGEYFPDPSPGQPDQSVYDFSQTGLPELVIPYDKSKPWDWQAVGSYTRFVPSGDNSDGHGPSGFQWGGGDRGIMDGWYWWWHGATAGTEYKHENAGNALDDGYGASDAGTKARQDESVKRGWGPLIGNPNSPDWKGLRYDQGNDQWFWFWDTAPAWAKAPTLNMLLNQAILDYKACVAAAQADAAAQAAQDKLDAANAAQLAKQQAAEDAQMAHQQEVEQSQAEHQAALQAVADDTAAKQQAAQQQVSDESAIRQAQAQAEIDAKAMAAQADIEQRAAMTAAQIQMMREQAGLPPDDGGGGVVDQSAMAVDDDGLPAASDEGGDMDASASLDAASLDDLPADADVMGAVDRLRLRRELRR